MIAFNKDLDHLIVENLGLVPYMARRLPAATRKLGWDEATAIGNLALCQAAKTFNPTHGNFSSYACVAISRALQRESSARFPAVNQEAVQHAFKWEPEQRDDRTCKLSVLTAEEREAVEGRYCRREKVKQRVIKRALEKLRRAAEPLA